MNNLHLCKSIIRAIDSPNIDIFMYPKSEQVTYKFYCGQKAIYDCQLRVALENLEFSFTHCTERMYQNKRLILFLLIPLKMLHGYKPSEDLLVRYEISFLMPMVYAIENGIIIDFEREVIKYRNTFIKYGIYLIFLRLKLICIKNLFRLTHEYCETHQVKLLFFFEALQLSTDYNRNDADKSEACSENEMLCYLISCISNGLIKGYISDKHKTLVLSKTNPFPSEVNLELFEV